MTESKLPVIPLWCKPQTDTCDNHKNYCLFQQWKTVFGTKRVLSYPSISNVTTLLHTCIIVLWDNSSIIISRYAWIWEYGCNTSLSFSLSLPQTLSMAEVYRSSFFMKTFPYNTTSLQWLDDLWPLTSALAHNGSIHYTHTHTYIHHAFTRVYIHTLHMQFTDHSNNIVIIDYWWCLFV